MLNIASRYASSLFEKAKEKNSLDLIKKEIEEFINLLEKDKTISEIWNSFSISFEEKEKLILKNLNFSDITKNFLKLLILKKRQNILKKIHYYYKNLYNEFNKILEVKVVLPFKIEIQQLNNLIKTLESKINYQITIKSISIDPEIIGGLIILSEDSIFDLSLKKELENLLKNFKQIVNENLNI